MDMTTYLGEVQEAGEQLLVLLQRDTEVLQQLEVRRDEADSMFRFHDESATMIGGPFSDDIDYGAETSRAGLHHRHRKEAGAEIAQLHAAIESRRLSRSVLAGAILQLGKQGISAIHGRTSPVSPERRSMECLTRGGLAADSVGGVSMIGATCCPPSLSLTWTTR